jgi:hypothetical protein
MCVCRNQILLNLNKLHCIIIAMPCIPSHDHVDSFSILVSVASVVCCSDFFLPDRTFCGGVSNDKFFGSLSTMFYR